MRLRSSASFRSGAFPIFACALGGVALAGALVLEGPSQLRGLAAPKPAIALAPSALPATAVEACASCHAEVAAEWKGTAHALAWVDLEYVEALKEKKKPETCYGCHAPTSLFAGDLTSKPAARTDARELGVSCESCHVSPDGAVQGPRGTPTSAHASKASDVFTTQKSNALCASCHRFNIGPVVGIAKDFEAAKMAERGLSCLGCHAHEVEMRFANAPDGAVDEAIPLRSGKSHAIQTPRDPQFLRRAFGLSLRVEGGRSVVTVANLTGHRVPGLIGRSIEFEARAFDAQGVPAGVGKLVLDAASYLPVDGRLEIVVPAAAAEIAIVGTHEDPRAKAPVKFLDERLAPQPR